MNLQSIILVYSISINLAAILLTVYDKYAAKNGKWRIKETTLFVVAALSGCVIMYVTMRCVRHKTKKLKFMLGIPLLFFAEAIAAVLLYINVW